MKIISHGTIELKRDESDELRMIVSGFYIDYGVDKDVLFDPIEYAKDLLEDLRQQEERRYA